MGRPKHRSSSSHPLFSDLLVTAANGTEPYRYVVLLRNNVHVDITAYCSFCEERQDEITVVASHVGYCRDASHATENNILLLVLIMSLGSYTAWVWAMMPTFRRYMLFYLQRRPHPHSVTSHRININN
jgi:hypothetical protein